MRYGTIWYDDVSTRISHIFGGGNAKCGYKHNKNKNTKQPNCTLNTVFDRNIHSSAPPPPTPIPPAAGKPRPCPTTSCWKSPGAWRCTASASTRPRTARAPSSAWRWRTLGCWSSRWEAIDPIIKTVCAAWWIVEVVPVELHWDLKNWPKEKHNV